MSSAELKVAVDSGNVVNVEAVVDKVAAGITRPSRASEAMVAKLFTPEIIESAKKNDKIRDVLVSFVTKYAPTSRIPDQLLSDVYKRLNSRSAYTYGTGGRVSRVSRKTRKSKKSRKTRRRV